MTTPQHPTPSTPPKHDGLAGKTVRGVIWSTGGTLAAQFIQFAIFLVLARLLTPADYGLVAIAVLFLALLQLVVEGGFTHAIVQRKDLTDNHLSTGFWINLSLGALCAVALFSAAPLLARYYESPVLRDVVRVMSVNLLIAPFSSVPLALLRREMRFKAITARSLISTSAAGAVAIALAFAGAGVWALVANGVVGAVVGAALLWRVTSFRPSRIVSARCFKDLWSFGINIQGSNLVNFANDRAADFAIAHILGKSALGFYTVAGRISSLVSTLVVQSTATVAFSTFAKLQEDPPRFARAYYSAVGLTSVIALPAFVGLSVLSPEIVAALLGEKWADTAPLMRIVSLLGIVTSIGSYTVAALAGLGRPAWNFRLDLLNALVTISLIVAVGLLDGGIEAIVWAFVGRAFVLWPIRYALLTRIAPVTFAGLGRAVAGPAIACIVMAAGLTAMRRLIGLFDLSGLLPSAVFSLVLLGLMVFAGASMYLLALRVTAPAAIRRLRDLLSGVRRKVAGQ